MGNLLINGKDVNNYIGELYNNSDKRTKASNVIGTRLKGFNSDLDSQSKKVAIGDTCDAFNGKVKHNGSIITIAPVGTRPMNETETRITGDNFTKYLVNKNGLLVISDSNPAEVGIDAITGLLPNNNRGIKSTDKNKKIVVTLAMWGAGGKGGGGAYFTIFMGPSGNYGGVGGSGGGKAFVKLEMDNNTYCKIYAPTKNFVGRYTSDEEYTYPASPCILNCYGVDVVTCYGGRSGVSCSRHTRYDNEIESNSMASGGETSYIYYDGIFKGGIIPTLCMRARGGNKVDTGYEGRSSTFETWDSLQYGNPENVQGLVTLTGIGGKGYGRADSRGSGGGGSYGNGGNGGDMGSGSGGSSGNAGGGGGGAGSPAGGADGGNGGYAGFSVFY